MKKLVMFAMVLSSISFARSVRPVALESVDMPLRLHMTESSATIIRVALDGEVFGGTCGVRAVFGRPRSEAHSIGHPIQINYADCTWKTVKFLSGSDMNEIVRQTALARQGVIQHPDPRALRCLAIPTRSIRMTADNGSVFLKSGAFPCGGQSFNRSEAAQQLVKQLNTLRVEYNKLVD